MFAYHFCFDESAMESRTKRSCSVVHGGWDVRVHAPSLLLKGVPEGCEFQWRGHDGLLVSLHSRVQDGTGTQGGLEI